MNQKNGERVDKLGAASPPSRETIEWRGLYLPAEETYL